MKSRRSVRGRNSGFEAPPLVLALGSFGEREKTRAARDGDSWGSGARKAIRKSRAPLGEDGVTMIAGRAALSSTIGFERSVTGIRCCYLGG